MFVVDADGRNLRQLSSATLPPAFPTGPRTAHGSSLRPSSSSTSSRAATTLQKISQDVYTVRPDWTDLRRLTTGRELDRGDLDARWSDPVRHRLYGGCAANGGLWTMDADGSNAVLLVPGGSGAWTLPFAGIDAAGSRPP